MIRKFKRIMLKKELGSNDISEEFHKRYGYKPNITKQELKLKHRLKRKLKKLFHLKVRQKRKRGNNENNH